jgi:hypothetical protein
MMLIAPSVSVRPKHTREVGGADHPIKYGGMEVSEAKRLKGLEDENARLKRLLADAMLDNAALKDLLSKKW